MKLTGSLLLLAGVAHAALATEPIGERFEHHPDHAFLGELFDLAEHSLNNTHAIHHMLHKAHSSVLAMEGIAEVYLGTRLTMLGLHHAMRSHLHLNVTRTNPEMEYPTGEQPQKRISLYKLLQQYAPKHAFPGKDATHDLIAMLKEVFSHHVPHHKSIHHPPPVIATPFWMPVGLGRARDGNADASVAAAQDTVGAAIDNIASRYQSTLASQFGDFPGQVEIAKLLKSHTLSALDGGLKVRDRDGRNVRVSQTDLFSMLLLSGSMLSQQMHQFKEILHLVEKVPGMDALRGIVNQAIPPPAMPFFQPPPPPQPSASPFAAGGQGRQPGLPGGLAGLTELLGNGVAGLSGGLPVPIAIAGFPSPIPIPGLMSGSTTTTNTGVGGGTTSGAAPVYTADPATATTARTKTTSRTRTASSTDLHDSNNRQFVDLATMMDAVRGLAAMLQPFICHTTTPTPNTNGGGGIWGGGGGEDGPVSTMPVNGSQPSSPLPIPTMPIPIPMPGPVTGPGSNEPTQAADTPAVASPPS